MPAPAPWPPTNPRCARYTFHAEDHEGLRAIKAGKASTIQLGYFNTCRNCSLVSILFQRMQLMLHAKWPVDYVIVPGTPSLRYFAQAAFCRNLYGYG